MEKIDSFKIDHLLLERGLYISRKDYLKQDTLTTFDIRMTRPNHEPVMDTAAIHTIEHIGATFLRNHTTWKSRIIYFGPMGCRTGFYLILTGDLICEDIKELIKDMFIFIVNYEGEIPGASAKDCGNYLDMDLKMAKYYSEEYLKNQLFN